MQMEQTADLSEGEFDVYFGPTTPGAETQIVILATALIGGRVVAEAYAFTRRVDEPLVQHVQVYGNVSVATASEVHKNTFIDALDQAKLGEHRKRFPNDDVPWPLKYSLTAAEPIELDHAWCRKLLRAEIRRVKDLTRVGKLRRYLDELELQPC
jgi:hypothetical protein